MYSKLPSFVLGYHGCDQSTKEAILNRKESLLPSQNDYDWLGSGVYFWEKNARRAMNFAIKARDMLTSRKVRMTSRPIERPAVIGTIIDLGNCMNLMDAAHIESLRIGYRLLKQYSEESGVGLPVNSGGSGKVLRRLDMAVIEAVCNHLIKHPSKSLPPYDTVRGLFQEGEPVYEGVGFLTETHIQICVRNPDCILEYFDPRTLA